jgi:uncharacterized membrane protein
MQEQHVQCPEQNKNNYKLGLFYYNPSDPRVSVPKRRGFGLTCNFARFESYLLLSIPFVIGAAILATVWFVRG